MPLDRSSAKTGVATVKTEAICSKNGEMSS